MTGAPMHFGRGTGPGDPTTIERASASRSRGLRRQSKKAAKRERFLAATKKRLLALRGDRCEARLLYLNWRWEHPGYRWTDAVPVAEEACGGFATELHHIAGRDFKRADEDFNLMLLCSTCHRLATDAHPIAFELGIARRSWETAA